MKKLNFRLFFFLPYLVKKLSCGISIVKYANKNASIGPDNLNISIRNNIVLNSTEERILKLSLIK